MSFLGLEIAKRALLAHQQAMDTAGHNIANARTPGFSRQRVNLRTTMPSTEVLGRVGRTPVGTGVEVADITRMRDAFLDEQYRGQAKGLGEWDVRDRVFNEVEQIFNEPSDTSLRTVMDQFWVAWQTLANGPENLAARETVLQRSNALVETFRHLDRQLGDLQANLNKDIEAKVSEINVLAGEIAAVNARVAPFAGAGTPPNDLLDQRDLLIDKLARLVDTQTVEGQNGMVRVLVNGVAIVDGVNAYRLAAVPDPANGGFFQLQWEGFGAAVRITGGEMAAYFDLRDNVLAQYRSQLKDLAWTAATQVNALHGAGFDLNGMAVSGTAWQDFFTLPPLKSNFLLQSFAVNPQVAADVRRIAAAAQAASPGDGRQALAIADLKFQQMVDLNGFTLDDFYRGVIGTLGTQADEAKRMQESQKALVDRIDNQRQAVSGVNLDEEMLQMIQFQHAFQAASRMVNLIDDALNTIINRMGLAGR